MAINNTRRKNVPATIGEFPDDLTWKWLASSQPLSREFIVENLEKLNIDILLANQALDKDTMEYLLLIKG